MPNDASPPTSLWSAVLGKLRVKRPALHPSQTLAVRVAACAVLSAALKRLDEPYTLNLLRLVPPGAWGHCPVISCSAKAIISALETGNAHELPESIFEDFDFSADPRQLCFYCEDLISRFRELQT